MRKGINYLVLSDSTGYYTPDATGPFSIYPMILQTHISSSLSIPVKLIHKGLGGSSSDHQVKAIRSLAQFSDLDIVTIGLGANDCGRSMVSVSNFGSNLRTIINFINRNNPNVKIVLCTPNTQGSTNIFTNMPDSNFTVYRTMCDTVSSEYSNVYACHFENAWSVSQSATYTADGTHPNPSGHIALEGLIYPIVSTIIKNPNQ